LRTDLQFRRIIALEHEQRHQCCAGSFDPHKACTNNHNDLISGSYHTSLIPSLCISCSSATLGYKLFTVTCVIVKLILRSSALIFLYSTYVTCCCVMLSVHCCCTCTVQYSVCCTEASELSAFLAAFKYKTL